MVTHKQSAGVKGRGSVTCAPELWKLLTEVAGSIPGMTPSGLGNAIIKAVCLAAEGKKEDLDKLQRLIRTANPEAGFLRPHAEEIAARILEEEIEQQRKPGGRRPSSQGE